MAEIIPTTMDVEDNIDRAGYLVEVVLMASASLERTSRAAIQEACIAIHQRLEAAKMEMRAQRGGSNPPTAA